jgi:hypothetical protein
MDDSKLAFGLGGQSGTSSISMSITNIKSDIVGLSTTITNTLQPAVDKLVRSLNSVHMPKLVDKNGNLLSSGFNGDSTNRIASLPPKAITSGNGDGSGNGGGNNGNNIVASNGSSSNFFSRNIGSVSRGMAATQGISDAVSNLLPSTQTSVMQDYLTNRSAFYGQGGYGGSLKQQTGAVRSLQQSLARNGTALNPMDTTNLQD